MSYYRYITGIYKSYWPELNRTLRSSSVPRTVPDRDPGRYLRGTSLPPDALSYGYSHTPSHYVTSCYMSARRAASPFAERSLSVPPAAYSSRSLSVPPAVFSSYSSRASSVAPIVFSSRSYSSHYTDFDCKVLSYSAELDRQETVRQSVSRSRNYATDHQLARHYSPERCYPADSFSSRYDYYAGNKHGSDGLYPCSREVLGTWKHYARSADTLRQRNSRARSPLVARELERYYETKKRSNYIGDISSGGANDFRYYNYRRVPYFGGSDNYTYMKQNPRSVGQRF